MADSESLRIAAGFSDQRLPTPELLKLEAADTRLRLIDAVWDAYIHSPAAEELNTLINELIDTLTATN